MLELAIAICEAVNLFKDHWVSSSPCSISCMEFTYADWTAGQGKEVASLRAMMVCSSAFLLWLGLGV